MAKNKIELKNTDLQKLLEEERHKLKAFRFGVSGSKSKNVKEGKTIKRNIARILTEITKQKNNNPKSA
ncbi:MAG: 50S ribosomal protein L29 [Candidatus Paceibacterota bacterium]|jgi:ribosomal protein L29